MIKERIPLWEGRDDVFLHTLLREYIPNPMTPEWKEDMPAVLICPGGAYMFCSVDLEGDTTALAFIQGGYQTFMLEYSFGSKRSDCAHPAQLLDLARAILIIRENARAWHVDPERIALAGFSAGGNLAANMATMWHIVFPQAFKAVLPALANEFVVLLKETSIAFYIGLGDLMYSINAIRAATYSPFMPLVSAAIIYLVMVLVLSKLVSLLERRLRNSER